jgi:hypothetical protein
MVHGGIGSAISPNNQILLDKPAAALKIDDHID